MAAACTAAILLACSDSDPDVPPLPTATPGARPSLAPASPTAAASPSPSPTPDAALERQRVIDAATAAVGGGRYISPLTLAACLQDNPTRLPCVELKTDAAHLSSGVARFALGDPDGGGSTFLMGRSSSGDWGFWRGTQQQSYLLDELPGTVLACGKDADAVIRVEPSENGGMLQNLPDLTEAQVDQLVLTRPGEYGVQGARGEAWYRTTAPVAGWLDATDTTAASLGDCLLHDEVEQVDRG